MNCMTYWLHTTLPALACLHKLCWVGVGLFCSLPPPSNKACQDRLCQLVRVNHRNIESINITEHSWPFLLSGVSGSYNQITRYVIAMNNCLLFTVIFYGLSYGSIVLCFPFPFDPSFSQFCFFFQWIQPHQKYPPWLGVQRSEMR